MKLLPHKPPTLAGDLRTANALANLAIARGGLMDEIIGEVYTKQLEDVDPDLVDRACRQLANQPRKDYETLLPSVGTIRELAHQLARADAAPAKYLPPRPDERTYACGKCFDDPAGWRQIQCLGGSTAACGRSREHGAHPFAVRCVCWLRRNADAIRFSYQQSLQKNQPPPREYAALTALESGAYAWN